jgi:hypothetical protein
MALKGDWRGLILRITQCKTSAKKLKFIFFLWYLLGIIGNVDLSHKHHD